MSEFEIMNVKTKECELIFGYSLEDAFSRYPGLNPNDWCCIQNEYID